MQDLTAYLDGLAAAVLALCPADTPVTVLGCGEGAAAATRWLAGSRLRYERLVLYAAVFPPEIDRRSTLVGLPEKPVLVVSPASADPGLSAADDELLQDLLDVGLPARLQRVAAGPLQLAALTAAGEALAYAPTPNPTV